MRLGELWMDMEVEAARAGLWELGRIVMFLLCNQFEIGGND